MCRVRREREDPLGGYMSMVRWHRTCVQMSAAGKGLKVLARRALACSAEMTDILGEIGDARCLTDSTRISARQQQAELLRTCNAAAAELLDVYQASRRPL